MMGKVSLFGLLLLLMATGAQQSSAHARMPSCPDTHIDACPMNFAPLCGTDGNTYANECALCVQRQTARTDILIAKDGSC